MALLLSLLLALGDLPTPPHLYKILSLTAWTASQGQERLALGPDDARFIHLAEAHQIERIARKFFSGEPEVVVVELDPTQFVGRLVLEANPGGSQRYYHLYEGYIPQAAVVSHRVLKNSAG